MKRVVVVVKPKGRGDPIHVILPGGSKVLRVTKMTNREIDDAEDHGNEFFDLRFEGVLT